MQTSGIDELKKNVDTLIVIPNDKLLEIVDRRTSIAGCFEESRRSVAAGCAGYH